MNNKTIGKKIENYANKNIPPSKKEFGEFMYHAELIKRGHWDIHYQDLETMNPAFKEIIENICEEGSLFKQLEKDIGGMYDK